MPKGPQGQKRPADIIGLSVMIGKIATGEAKEADPDAGKNKAAVELGRKGGAARAAKMPPELRTEIAKRAARSRWEKSQAKRK